MSKGSKIVPVRLPAALLELVEIELLTRSTGPKGRPLTLSEWVRSAITEKLKHAKRSRKQRFTDEITAEYDAMATAPGTE